MDDVMAGQPLKDLVMKKGGRVVGKKKPLKKASSYWTLEDLKVKLAQVGWSADLLRDELWVEKVQGAFTYFRFNLTAPRHRVYRTALAAVRAYRRG